MSSRLPPPPGLNPRDRSPRHFGDRRPPVGPRGSDDVPPPYLAREPPRGPRALTDPSREGPFGGRGRGFSGRGDFRDRDRDIRGRDRDRDVRDHRDFRDGPPPFRRDVDRDWGRRDRDFDPRDSRIGLRRGNSRSPPPIPRDIRNGRESAGRDFDLIRMRRNSRDSVHSSSSIPDGPPPSVGHHPRGGPVRVRSRGRGSYLDGRDSFRHRSHSRDGRWDHDRDRDRGRDRDRDLGRDRDRDLEHERGRDFGRRGSDRRDLDRRGRFGRWNELDRRFDRDDRDGPGEHWDDGRPVTGTDSPVATSPYHPPPSISSVSATSDRLPDRHPRGSMQRGSLPGSSLDSDRWEAHPSRPDAKDFLPPAKSSPPPSAPQVPPFGSVTALIPGLPQKPAPDPVDAGPPSIKAEKQRPESPPLVPVQPPTGPKAERLLPRLPPSDPRLRREEGPEPQGRSDLASRISKRPAGPASNTTRQPLDISPPTDRATISGKDSPATDADAQSAKNLRSPSFALDFGRTPSSARPTSLSPQTSPSMPVFSIPTGPRALQQRQPAPRASLKMNKPWARSSYGRAPSLPDSAANTSHMPFEPNERSLSASEDSRRESKLFDDDERETPVSGEPAPKDVKGGPMPPSPPLKEADIRDRPPHEMPGEAAVPKANSSVEEGRNSFVPDFTRSSDEEDGDVFTQDYLEERKQIFERDIEALQANMPPPPLEDPKVVAMLLKIQLLGLAANDMMTGGAAELPAAGIHVKAPTASPATTLDYRADKEAEDKGSPIELASKGPTIEDLPFLNTGPPTPISDLEVYQENAANHERFREVFRTELMRRRKRSAQRNASFRADYISLYKPWRLDVWEQDRLKGKNLDSPGPASPPAPPIVATPPSIVEGRRFKGNSELDFQNALRASEISAQEELERRRGNKATAQPDLAREAVVPDMLEPQEAKCHVYKDSNNIVDIEKALSVFGFLPPVNDFTPEEHERFTNAFMAHPKRWGKIAESLPGRDFQQCIVHYYLTKEEIKYKAKLNKRWSRRGRAKRSIRPKSNALMADLGVVKPDYEGEEETPAVTDTGRPRRAAAPTFGDMATETDQTSNGRRSNGGKDGELGEKPVSRRGARGGPGSRGGRRGRAAQLQQQSQLAMEQQIPNVPAMSGTLFPKAEMEPSLDGTTEGASARVKEPSEREASEALPRARAGRGRTREGMYVFESMEPETAASIRQPEMGYGSLQPTSYWSVPEQRDFPQLLAHFGRDFEGISSFMKTKTTVMVKNYFQRRIDSGQKDFEDIVLVAEGKKARGEPTGPLPVPSVAPKRRYEATPSAIVPRPLAPHTEAGPDLDESRFASKAKPGVLSPQQAPLHARTAPDRERNAPRYPSLAQASSPPMSAPMPTPLLLNEDPSRGYRPHVPIQNRLQGPRLGYFSEERPDALAAYSITRPQEPQIPPRQPLSPVDAVRMESFRTSTADIRGSPLLSTPHIIPSSQHGYIQPQAQQPITTASHSRQPSLSQTPSSPAQHLHRQEPDVPRFRRDSIGQRQLYPLSGQPVGMPPPSPGFSPAREISRTGSTAIELREAPRQIPAKRSNIMNILNDEPEEPQPRKKFASDQASPIGTTASPSRPLYTGLHSLTQPAPALHQAESQFSASQPRPAYAQQSQYLPPPRTYTDYQGFGSVPGASGGPANNDWMARFDPRGQQQQQQQQQQPTQLSNRPSQATFSPYAQSQTQSGPPPASMSAPSPVPTASPASGQRATYPTPLFGQPLNSHTHAAGASRQEIAAQNQGYRQLIGSPPQRRDSVAYGPQQEPATPNPSPANLLNMGSHQPSLQSSYAPGVQATPGSSHLAGHRPTEQQTYQQHVQTMVNGAHQYSSASYADGQYGRGTPPPQVPSSRGLPGPSSLALGRSYTPPGMLQANAAGGVGYAAGGPSTPGAALLHSRRTGPQDEAAPGPRGHSRVYSQGSNTAPSPGPSAPQHMPR